MKLSEFMIHARDKSIAISAERAPETGCHNCAVSAIFVELERLEGEDRLLGCSMNLAFFG